VGSPLVIAFGDNQNFIASDALALAGHANTMLYLEEGDVAVLKADQVNITDGNGQLVERIQKPMPAQADSVDLDP
jgi:glucosamine--fructose-6-phosphate aminotransferase (isomerizing)